MPFSEEQISELITLNQAKIGTVTVNEQYESIRSRPWENSNIKNIFEANIYAETKKNEYCNIHRVHGIESIASSRWRRRYIADVSR